MSFKMSIFSFEFNTFLSTKLLFDINFLFNYYISPPYINFLLGIFKILIILKFEINFDLKLF